MRWPVVRLIAAREVRDQLRDRRTLFLILGLPVLMYPLFVGVGLLFVAAIKEKKLIVGVVGAEHLPKAKPDIAAVAGAAAGYTHKSRAFPPLIADDKFPDSYLATDPDGGILVIKPLESADESLLAARKVDAILVDRAEPDREARTRRTADLRVLAREGEENSKLTVRRLTGVLKRWVEEVKAVRFARAGLPTDFDVPIDVKDPLSDKPAEKKMFDELRDVLVKVIPFLLVMWMLTGAIYPAIDMTAGEKERGTMETLLISPAERSEIVMGKFFAVVAMGFGTAVWNVTLMLVAVAIVQVFFPHTLLSLPGLARACWPRCRWPCSSRRAGWRSASCAEHEGRQLLHGADVLRRAAAVVLEHDAGVGARRLFELGAGRQRSPLATAPHGDANGTRSRGSTFRRSSSRSRCVSRLHCASRSGNFTAKASSSARPGRAGGAASRKEGLKQSKAVETAVHYTLYDFPFFL